MSTKICCGLQVKATIGGRDARALLPKYVKRVRSKGRDYYYFDTGKRVDGKKVYARLPDIRDMKFGGSYAALMGHRNRKQGVEIIRVPRLIQLYQLSDKFERLSPASEKLYGIYLRKLEKLLPVAPVAEITPMDMQKLVDGMAKTPGAANAFVSVSSAMFAWGKKRGYVTSNPCEGIEPLEMGEHDPWPLPILKAGLEAENDTVRLLVHLLYYTSQRVSDVLRMAWTDIDDNRVTVVQEKTKKKLRIRLHDNLRAELSHHPRRSLLICSDTAGMPLKAGTVTKWLTAFSAAAGERCVPHGLRKNAVIALLEVGCTTGEIAAVSGQSLKMVEHYARGRDQSLLADKAVGRWERNGS